VCEKPVGKAEIMQQKNAITVTEKKIWEIKGAVITITAL